MILQGDDNASTNTTNFMVSETTDVSFSCWILYQKKRKRNKIGILGVSCDKNENA